MNIYKFHTESKSLLYHEIANEIIPKLFWEKYRDNQEELKKREKYIATSAEYAYYYSRHTLKCLFPAGEKAISKDAGYSYVYAKFILKCLFPLGEEVISKDKWYSYYYAKDILEGPFLAREEVISKDKDYTEFYLELLSDKEKEEFKRKYL